MARPVARNRRVGRDELLAFVAPRHHGILVTTRRDGRPQLSPVTMGLDGQTIVVSTYPERAKARNAKRNPAASICVLSDDFGGEWVQVDGRIEVVEGPEAIEALVRYYRAISGEHPDWEEYRAAMVAQGKVLLALSIEDWGPISRGGFPARLAQAD
ncbi:MAG: PPOX class F420-dependent oxidoreductase [Actinomycetota bacterium]|nr:PPOX class F420-dependent oxidoreductase [Actinomycetota bacterium]